MSRVGTFAALALFAAAAPASGESSRVCQRIEAGPIVGGTGASIKDWPGFVAFRARSSDGEFLYFCGGTAIAPLVVLTAAHCADDWHEDESGNWISTKGDIQAVVGTDSIRSVSSSQVRQIASVVLHEKWSGILERGDDIALVKLRAPVNSVSRLSTLPESDSAALAYAAGFGLISATRATGSTQSWRSPEGLVRAGSEILREVSLPIVTAQACSSAYPALNTSRALCAGYEAGAKDSCWGDSGGPLNVLDSLGCPYQVGIVSFGRGCAAKQAYGVYTRVSAYASWIRSQVPQLPEGQPIVPRAAGVVSPQTLDALLRNLQRGKQSVEAAMIPTSQLQLGDAIVVEFRSQFRGAPLVIDQNPSGEISQLFPNSLTPASELLVEANQSVRIPGPMSRYAFKALPPHGKGRIVVVVIPAAGAKWGVAEVPYSVAP